MLLARRRKRHREPSPGRILTNLLRWKYEPGFIELNQLWINHKRLSNWTLDQLEDCVLHSRHRGGRRFETVRFRAQGQLFVALAPHLRENRYGHGPPEESGSQQGVPMSTASGHGGSGIASDSKEVSDAASSDHEPAFCSVLDGLGDVFPQPRDQPKSPSPSSDSVPELPEGWASDVDPESGLKYFYSVVTGESRWTHPSLGIRYWKHGDACGSDVVGTKDISAARAPTQFYPETGPPALFLSLVPPAGDASEHPMEAPPPKGACSRFNKIHRQD